MAEVLQHQRFNPSYGLVLARAERRSLEVRGIRAFPMVDMVTQTTGRRLLRGIESGGGSRRIGHYVGFLGIVPDGFAIQSPSQELTPSRSHRTIWAPQLIRFEVFRYATVNIHLQITHHRIDGDGDAARHMRQTLFFARAGIFHQPDQLPEFLDRNGEKLTIPECLQPGFSRALQGARHNACMQAVFRGASHLTKSLLDSVLPSSAAPRKQAQAADAIMVIHEDIRVPEQLVVDAAVADERLDALNTNFVQSVGAV